MKFIVDNWLLILVAFTSGAMLLWPAAARGARAGALTPAGAVMLMNREKAVVVDLSDPKDFAAGHVTGARNVPFAEFEQRLPEVAKNKGVPLILVCQSGARAQRAVPVAKKLGYEKAQALAGGMRAWREANLPVEKA